MSKYAEISALAELVRSRVPIAEVIAESVALESCKGGYAGLCPFHTPEEGSLYVDAYYFFCSRCEASGNVIAFIMQLEGVVYPVAVQRLSERLPAVH